MEVFLVGLSPSVEEEEIGIIICLEAWYYWGLTWTKGF